MKLVKILSDKVQIRSDYKEYDVRINDLIAVSDGDVELVTMVNTLTDIDTEDQEEIGENDYILEHSSTKMLECSIIGTVKDGAFQKAIDRYPTMKVSAHFQRGICFYVEQVHRWILYRRIYSVQISSIC